MRGLMQGAAFSIEWKSASKSILGLESAHLGESNGDVHEMIVKIPTYIYLNYRVDVNINPFL